MNNMDHLICGRSLDTPISEKGIYQANLLGRRLRLLGVEFDEVYSSTARRTLETALNVGLELGFSREDILQTPELLELDQGEWEGKLRDEIYTPERLRLINGDNWNFTPPGGESQRDVEERVLGWINNNLVSRYSQGITAGIFTHGFAIKCLLRGVMEFSPSITYRLDIDNTSVTRLKYSENGWSVIKINDASHLEI